MAKKMLIDATHAEETRVVVVDGNKVEEFDFESENKRQLAGNIYLAKVTRVEPSLQAAFVDYGGNRHGFLAFSEVHPDYYQIPVADREALLAEEAAYAASLDDDEEDKPKRSRRSRNRGGRSKAEATTSEDAVETRDIPGMDVVDLDGDDADSEEGSSPVERVHETPVDTPASVDDHDHDHDHDDDHDHAHGSGNGESTPYRAMDDAADRDAEIESIAEEDVAEEIRQPRKPRARKYKIQEVIKVRQILLVQVVKEERGNKGAALTTYLSLAGRYCVLMPNTARGGGISRKITNAVDRKKLKEIAGEIDVPKGAGLIIRTAGAQRTKAEIKRDYEYLQRLWEQIRELTLKSIAPAKIYEEGDLIKRSIRDLYNKDIDEVIVEGEGGYRTAKDFMKMIMPSHAKNVKHYTEPMPLFARYQVETYLAGMFNPTVQLKSGGYIVIGVTEALVAIDVNSGRATKEGSIEETALKTNLEAAEEVARQLRLRDLAGLIVIDFIDMEERRNNAAVEKRFKDKLKTDRARIQVGRISGFGLMEMSRQRLRPGMLEATTQPCPACHGTGLVRSDDSLGLTILRQIEEEGTRKRSREVLVKAPVAIVNFLVNQKREHIAQIEGRYGMAVRIEADPFLISPDFSIEKFKTATRVVEVSAPVISGNASLMSDLEEEDEDVVDEAEVQEAEVAESRPDAEGSEGDGQPKKRRRRRRRRKGGGNGEGQQDRRADATAMDEGDEETASDEAETEAAEAPEAAAEEAPRKRSRSRSRVRKPKAAAAEPAVAEVSDVAAPAEVVEPAPAEAEPTAEAEVEKPKRSRAPRRKKAEPEAAAAEPAAEATAEVEEPKPAPKRRASKPKAEVAPEPALAEVAADVAVAEPAVAPVAEVAEASDKPKKKGWWSLGR